MQFYTRLLFVLSCFFPSLNGVLLSQNIALSTQNPAGLYVCGTQQMSVTVQNGTGSPTATTLRVSVVLPNGVTYIPGTISGAAEFNITNLGSPIFSLTDLAGGNSAILTLSVTAGCSLVDAINSGQQFSNSITATYAGGNQQLTSNNYIIETGLANIVSVTPTTVNAMQGDVIMRIIKLKNTRLGPIQSLTFRDQHTNGISVDIVGATNQNNSPTLYKSDIPGAFFTSFGDGDDLLESSDGEITIIEKVTITDCGVPSYTAVSDIIIGWGCGGNTCRTDSITAAMTILPSNQNPNLVFEPHYAAPQSYCGATPSVQEIYVINTGQLPAQNVLLDAFAIDTGYIGVELNSFEWSSDGITWQPSGIISSNPTTLASCGLTQYKLDVVSTIPEVPAGDTIFLRFNSYYCQPACQEFYPQLGFVYVYNKACPPNVSTNGAGLLAPDSAFLKVSTALDFNIGHCLDDDSTYTLHYWVKSKRLTVDTGYLQIILNLPKGLSWNPSCNLVLDGQTPMDFTVDVDPNSGSTTIRGVFDLPFTQDSVGDDICITYNCMAGLPCEASVPNVPPRGLNYTVYPPPSDCHGCELKISLYSILSNEIDATPDCGITACDLFTMVVNDDCNGGGNGGGGGVGGGSGDLAYTVGFNSWRINRGLQDDNNDRNADSGATAANPNMRVERFLTGDTIRNQLQVAVTAGELGGVNYRLFLETMTSDFGLPLAEFSGDSFSMAAGRPNLLFTNYDTTSFAGGRVIIKKAGGGTFKCPLTAPLIRSDQHIIQVAQPNIKPAQIYDVIANMFDQYGFSVSDGISSGCLPPGFTIGAGDSLFVQMDYKFENNFTPPGGGQPPLVNFRTSVCAPVKTYSWKLPEFCTEKPMRQFSGYIENIELAKQIIAPCNTSSELAPFGYGLRIARENLFPFEVRQLVSVNHYSYSLPTAVSLLDTKLNFLRLQEAVPVFSNVSLMPGFAGDSLSLDLSQFFANPLDEGFSFEISTRFDTTCGYDGSKFGRTNLGLTYANECFHHPKIQTYSFPNPNGYVSGSPQIDFFNIGTGVVDLPTNDVTLNFTLRNSSPVAAPHSWIIIDAGTDLSDVQLFLIDPPNLIPVPQVGGVFQLDTLDGFEQPFFRLKAKSQSCGPFTVHYRFGWSCTPVYNDQDRTCGEFSGTVEVRPQKPELELTIIKEQTSIPLCSPSGDFEFEISNANDGSAYHVVPSVKLPQGIHIVPNSARLQFPAGVGIPLTLPDPVMLPGNVYQFNPEAISTILAQNGLVSFEQEPLNAMRILFKVQAECGAVANAQPVYGAEAVQPCGVSSNVLRKPGQPININGVNPTTMSVANLNFVDPNATVACGQPVQLKASISLDGVPMSGDSIYITLPAGTSFVTGSYAPGVNAPAGPPQVVGQLLRLPFPANLPGNAVMNFSFSVRYDSPAGCADKIVTLQTREKTQAFCGATACDVYVATSEAMLNLNAQNPELQFVNFQVQSPAGGPVTFSGQLNNVGSAAANNPVVQIYQDANGNGIIDPTDPLITTVNYSGSIASGASGAVNGTLNVNASAYCNLIALIPASENCACADHVFPIGGNQIITQGIGLCMLQPVAVGTDSIPGNTYEWLTPDGLSCIHCAHAMYTPGPDVPAGSLITLVLREKSGDCTIERRYEIQFGGNFGIESSSMTICEGTSASLEATPGGISYAWSGPGISNPGLQNQVVTPVGNSVYAVTVTFAGGCSGTGTITVLVNPAKHTTFNKHTCNGQPLDLFGDMSVVTDVAGTYTQNLSTFNGCDSIITVNLVVPAGQTESTVNLCRGDSIKIEGTVFKDSGTKCVTYASVSGCDSVHCYHVTLVERPVLPQVDSVILQKGEEITLNGPAGFHAYQWTPTTHLTCSDCQNPVANPDSSTTYILVVNDNNGCRDTASYRVFICDVAKYLDEIPNAFTPNGDGNNDVFRPVPREGAEMLKSVEVYDRWGIKIYAGTGPNAAWDGTIKGKPAPSDVYVWIITAECSGFTMKKHGQITLLR